VKNAPLGKDLIPVFTKPENEFEGLGDAVVGLLLLVNQQGMEIIITIWMFPHMIASGISEKHGVCGGAQGIHQIQYITSGTSDPGSKWIYSADKNDIPHFGDKTG
jgi:hypothetical protein